MKTFNDLEFEKIDSSGKIAAKDFAGKLILIVNTASMCGFTEQYKDLETLWKKYKDKGLLIIGIPTNDFGKQEPAPNEQIASFCEVNFGVSFPISKKEHTTGPGAHPFFQWSRKNFGFLSGPKWNFYKYLIGKDGEPIAWFSSIRSPLDKKFVSLIEKNLPQ